jgi:hypothetical protein
MSPLTESTRLTLAKGQPVPNDPSFAFNSLLLHGNGTNGSTVITDSSGSPKAVTAVGNAQISTAQSKFGGSSIAFNGTNSYIQSASNTAFSYGTGDFTIEFWAYLNSTADQAFYETQLVGGIGTRANGFVFVLSSGKLNVFSGGTFRGASTTSVTSLAWHHIALVRSGNTFTYYLNGVNDGSFSALVNPAINVTDSSFLCGRLTDTAGYFLNGYIDDLRITKGVARYTSNFTPPTLPFPDF